MHRVLNQVGEKNPEKMNSRDYPAALFKGKGGACEIILKQT